MKMFQNNFSCLFPSQNIDEISEIFHHLKHFLMQNDILIFNPINKKFQKYQVQSDLIKK